jgi:hypothetical protein
VDITQVAKEGSFVAVPRTSTQVKSPLEAAYGFGMAATVLVGGAEGAPRQGFGEAAPGLSLQGQGLLDVMDRLVESSDLKADPRDVIQGDGLTIQIAGCMRQLRCALFLA